jgi:tripartite-type tricarboxylate transporter receptor subunit TctC
MEEVPSFIPGRTWIGLMGPPHMSEAITARLHDEMRRIINSADVQHVLADNGLETIANSPADFAAMIKEDTKIWDAAAASTGLIAQ